MVWDVTSYAHTKTIKVTHLKAVNLTLTPRLTKVPTSTPTLTPRLTPTPTIITVSPTPTSVPFIVSPTLTQAHFVNNSISDYLLGKVNEYRKSLGLYEVKSDSNTCDFANKRVSEISTNFNHDGFKNLPYPSYSKVTENIAMNSDYKEVVNQWIASLGHAENMRADTPFVCIENSGNYYVYEGWKP